MEPQPPARRVESDRLVVRCWQPDDLEMLHEAVTTSVDHLLPWMEWAEAEPISREERLEFLLDCRSKFDAGEDYIYGIFDADETRALGGTGLHTRRGEGVREIGYWIREDATEQGFATEATAALTRAAFEVDEVARVEIRVAPHHPVSGRIPERLGFRREGTLRNCLAQADGTHRDTTIWGMTPDDYGDSPAAAYDIRAFDVLGREFELSGTG